MQQFWALVPLTLNQIARRLESSFGLKQFDFDQENLWMWFEAMGPEQIHWNVSREHHDGKECFDARLSLHLKPLPDDISSWGCRLAEALACPVTFGTVRYLGGNDFAYTDEKLFYPQATSPQQKS